MKPSPGEINACSGVLNTQRSQHNPPLNKQQQQRHILTVEKEPSPRIFPNLKSSGRFLRGCGGSWAGCCCKGLVLGRASAVVPSMVGPCLVTPLGMPGAELDSVWDLTIDGDGQEHSTTLDWMGTASYCKHRGKRWESRGSLVLSRWAQIQALYYDTAEGRAAYLSDSGYPLQPLSLLLPCSHPQVRRVLTSPLALLQPPQGQAKVNRYNSVHLQFWSMFTLYRDTQCWQDLW